jgi:uncharacterized membrane protein YraQ (UPF0718 family)
MCDAAPAALADGQVRRHPDAYRLALLAGLAIVVALMLARVGGVGDGAAAENFVVVFTSIVVEALPFVMLGALVSALIEVVVPERAFDRLARLPARLQVPGAVAGGLAFPVCECGSVPVARRLILKGMHPAAGVAFMLAAPIVNPVVIASTFVAYQGRAQWEMVLGRVILGMGLALVVGWMIGRRPDAGTFLRRQAHDHADHGGGRLSSLVEHWTGDAFFMGKFVVAGGALAAALQTAVPQDVFSGLLGSAPVSAVVMMALAFCLSLCSEADAFVAISFGQFPLSSQLAFLVFGPVIDIKLVLLYAATFGRAFVLDVMLLAAAATLTGAMFFDLLVA